MKNCYLLRIITFLLIFTKLLYADPAPSCSQLDISYSMVGDGRFEVLKDINGDINGRYEYHLTFYKGEKFVRLLISNIKYNGIKFDSIKFSKIFVAKCTEDRYSVILSLDAEKQFIGSKEFPHISIRVEYHKNSIRSKELKINYTILMGEDYIKRKIIDMIKEDEKKY